MASVDNAPVIYGQGHTPRVPRSNGGWGGPLNDYDLIEVLDSTGSSSKDPLDLLSYKHALDSPLRRVNHARARLLRQAAPLRAFAIHRRNYSTCPASGSNTTDRIRCADTVRHLTTSGLVPLTGGKRQDSWRTREYGDVVNLCPAPTKRDNDCESLLTQRSPSIRNSPS